MNELSTNRIVNINPSEVFSELGVATSTQTQEVNQSVGSISVSTAAEDVDYVEVLSNELNNEPLALSAVDSTNTQTPQSITVDDLLELIPSNPTIAKYDILETTSRFSGAKWYDEVRESTIILAGCGGIGSNCLYLLARMQPKKIVIYDDDEVETANLSGQMFTNEMIGRRKVDACADIAFKFSNYSDILCIREKYTAETEPGDIMICGFDSIEARKIFFASWLSHVKSSTNPRQCLYIDARLSMEEFQIYCVCGDDNYNIQEYTKTLFRAEDAEATVCSMKQTSHCAQICAGMMVNLFTNFMANKQYLPIPRPLPFKTYYDASLMYFKVEG